MTSLTSQEKQRLWHLFQACDTDSDGFINSEDIRMLSSRSELSDYNPEEIIDLFTSMSNNPDNNSHLFTFEDFVNKKLAHEQLSQMSETTSMSSGFTNPSTDGGSIHEHFNKRLIYGSTTAGNGHRNHNQYQYNGNLNKYKTDFLDDIDSSLSKSMDNLQLGANRNYRTDLDAARRVFTAIPSIKNVSKYELKSRMNKIHDLKRFKNYLLPEDIERFDMSDDAKKKFELIRQDYFNCLNELSEENESICEELDRTMKERNYLREKIEILRDEFSNDFRKHREQWICERQKLEQKINSLESYISKLSYSMKPDDMVHSWFNHGGTGGGSIIDNPDIINDNNPDKYATRYQAHIFNENFKLHQLANKISELALFLSEIISNLRKSEIEIMMANCRAAGIVKNDLRDDDEEEIMHLYERAMLNRSLIEREAIDFIRNLDKEILVQYLTPAEFQKLFKNNRQITFDMEFQNILLDLLVKLKDDLRNVNKTLDQQQLDQSEKFSVDTYNTYLQDYNYKI